MNPPKNYRTKENNNMPFIGLHTTLYKIVISEHHKHQVNDEFHSKQLMSIT